MNANDILMGLEQRCEDMQDIRSSPLNMTVELSNEGLNIAWYRVWLTYKGVRWCSNEIPVVKRSPESYREACRALTEVYGAVTMTLLTTFPKK